MPEQQGMSNAMGSEGTVKAVDPPRDGGDLPAGLPNEICDCFEGVGEGCGLVEPRPRAYGQPDGRQTAAVHEVAHRLAGWARPHRVHSPDGCSRILFSE